MDQEKEANPIAEIFDEVFTLMEDLETRSGAILEYMKEQGGVSDEKLAPYVNRAAAASDVRWRAARARMEHLLAPKPKSSTDAGNDQKAKGESQSQPQAKGKDAESEKAKSQEEKEKGTKPGSKEIGKELSSAQPGAKESTEPKDGKSQNTITAAESKSDRKEAEDGRQDKEPKAASKDAESQAAALGREKKSDSRNGGNATDQNPQFDGGNSGGRSAEHEKQKAQETAK